jgi:hypothetical protein
MKFNTTIRKGLVIAGFAAFALLPATMKAQEITNTEFSDGPNVAALAQPAAAQQTNGTMTYTIPAPQAMMATTAVASSAVDPQQAELVSLPSVSTDEWIIAGLATCAGLIVLLAVAEIRRAHRNSSRGTYVSTRTA